MARYPSTVMVSIVCPWDDDEQLDEAIFRRATRHALDSGFRQLYVFGTAGEGYAVDSARFRRVIEVFGDELSGTDATPTVGVIGLSTANVIERLGVAHALGFRAFQISLPSWQVPTDAEVVAYFESVCGAFPDSTFMHYNTARVGRLVNGRLYAEIVARVPNLVATKTMTGDLGVVAGVVRDAPELMHFLTEQSIAYGALFGEVALLGTYAALAPERSWALLDAVQGGRHEEAARIGSWFESAQRGGLRPADGRPPGRWGIRQDHREAGARHGRLPAPDAVAVPDRLGSRVPGRTADSSRPVPGARGRTRGRDRRDGRECHGRRTMIIDSHVYCFVAPDEPAGHPDVASHMGEIQVFHALHHQPAWRTRDRAPSDAKRLLDPTPDDPLRPAAGVDFRVDRTHNRLTWTLDGEDHAKQIYPPNLPDVAFGPGNCIAEMDYAGVDVALMHVDRALGLDVSYLADCVRAYPGRLYSMAPVDEAAIPGDPDRVIRDLDEAIRVHGLHVIKFIPEYAYRAGSDAWDDGPFRPFWEAATALGVPVAFTLGASPGHTDERDGFIAELGVLQRWMERYPDAQAYVTHGFPYRAFLEDDRLVLPDRIWEPFQNPRLRLEVSFPVRLGDLFDYPYRECWPALETMLRKVGARNLMWGTDMPFQNRFCTYRQSRRWIETCGLLTDDELAQVMGGTTAEMLGITAPGAGGQVDG